MFIQTQKQSVYDAAMKKAANFIKQIREDRDISTAKLASMMNTTPQQISHLELGKRKLSWEWILRLADALQCHPLDITEGPAKPKAPQERDLLNKFRQLGETEQGMFITMLDSLTTEKTGK